MRKLRLQMQITVDGFVAGPEGQLDWMSWDEALITLINDLIDRSDTILMGRKMTPGFVNYWEQVITRPENPEYEFGLKMVNTPKIVFSRSINSIEGRNVRVENGPLPETVTRMKNEPGKDLLVYGGAAFVSSLIENDLIDELNLFVNPVAIGQGLPIFRSRRPLKLKESVAYRTSGIVVNTYEPQR